MAEAAWDCKIRGHVSDPNAAPGQVLTCHKCNQQFVPVPAWRTIESAEFDDGEFVQLWNGECVTVGYHHGCGRAWCDALADFKPVMDPQPTHWQPLAEGPDGR